MFRSIFHAARRLLTKTASRKKARAARPTRLGLENLENRLVPAILFHQGVSVTLSDRNQGQTTPGTVLQNPQVELIFWGSKWNNGSNPTLRNNVTNAVADIIQSTYVDKLGQYGVGSGVLEDAGAPVTITTTSPGANFKDVNVSSMLQNNIGKSIPYHSNWLYIVITQPGSTDPTDVAPGIENGKHSIVSVSGKGNAYYGWTENVGGAGAMDDITRVFSHEYVEAVTDPDGTGWQVNKRSSKNWNEICDGEAQNYTFRVDGFLVQSYYSQEDNAYAVDNGSTANFLVDQTGVLTVQADPFSYSDLEVNLIGSGVFAEINDSTAQFDPGAISAIQINGATGDLIYVDQTNVPVAIDLRGGDAQQVLVCSPSHNLDNIQGPVVVQNGTASDILVMHDENAPPGANQTYAATDSSVTRAGCAGISFSGLDTSSNVYLYGSSGTNIYWAVGTSSLVLGDYYGASGHLNQEAVVLQGSSLNHYYRDADTLAWHYDGTIVTDASGPGSLILGDYVGANGHHNLEVVVQEGSSLNHYYRDADTLAWHYDGTIVTDASGPGSLILGDYVAANGHRNLELVVQEGSNLNGYYRDANTLAWHYDATIVTDASGPGSLILGDYVAANGHRNLELVVQEGSNLNGYYRDANTLAWHYDGTIVNDATGPASLILGDYVGASGHRNLELVVQEGSSLNEYYRDADTLAWHYDGTIVNDATGPASLILGDYVGASGHRNLEVVAQEGGGLDHYYRDSDALDWVFAEGFEN